eukprot:TRINITY_DN23857_c0_g1_i1.p1 TRINITY_DN23857_c0_g1~~TRINITY_DN23857_c0_g1_i1.p1  ORF type:complete len:832 (+),score=233.29 TRINITY_DN23857_c0_g1_i1:111-2606(+)
MSFPVDVTSPRGAPLTQAGLELVRNRTAAQAEAVKLAASLVDTADWRVKLGAGSALSRIGAPQLEGHPDVRSHLFHASDGVKQLIASTLAGEALQAVTTGEASDACPAISENEARTLLLLRSEDWRIRCGAAEAIGHRTPAPVEHAPFLSELLVADVSSEVRAAAAGALRHFGADVAAPALARGLVKKAEDAHSANIKTTAAEELLVEFLDGDATRVTEMVRNTLSPEQHQERGLDLLCDTRAQVLEHLPVIAQIMKEEQDCEEEEQQKELDHKWRMNDLQLKQWKIQEMQLQQMRLFQAQPEPDLPAAKLLGASTRPALKEPDESVEPLLGQRPRPKQMPRRRRQSAEDPAQGHGASEAGAVPATSSTSRRTKLHQDPRVQAEAALTEAAGRLNDAQSWEKLTADELIAIAPELEKKITQLHPASMNSGAFASERIAAMKGLGRLGALAEPQHVTTLALQLGEPESCLRQVALQALGDIGFAKPSSITAIVPKMALLLEDKDVQVQRAAIRALAGFGPSTAAASVVAQLRSDDAAARQAAKQALLEMHIEIADADPWAPSKGQVLMKTLLPLLQPILEAPQGAEKPETRAAAASVIEKLRRPQASKVDKVAQTELGRQDDSKAVATPTVEAAVAAGLLEDPDAEIRCSAAQTLGRIGAVAAPHAEALARLLEDEAEPVRRAVAEALPALHGCGLASAAVPIAVGFLTHKQQSVRRAANYVLEHFGALAKPFATIRNLTMLEDDCATLRCRGVEELAKIHKNEGLSDELVKAVADLRIDTHWAVRLAVAKFLISIGELAAQHHRAELEQLALDSDWRVRRAIAEAETAVAA